MKKIATITISILMLLVCQLKISSANELKLNKYDFGIINNQKFFLNVADTPEKKIQGLMYIDKIAEDQGMIFLFKNPDYKNFWMKNMKISLDIVFLYNDKIVTIYKEVPVCEKDPCPLYVSKYKIDTVLEFQKGFCEKFNIKIGDKIKLSKDIKLIKSGLKDN
ncbi:MAG: DUF192 domain-containing protein [bacterium]